MIYNGQPMVTKDKHWWTFEVLGPSMIYNGFNREISCHRVTASPCHGISQSFAFPLPPNQSVSHLPCPLPPNQSVIWLTLYHRITASPWHCITTSLCHRMSPCQSVICLVPCHQTSQSFDLPSTTVSPCHCITMSLHHHVTTSPHQSVICLAPCHQTSQSFALPPATKPVSHLTCPLPPRHRVTASPHHCITTSRISQSFALPPATKPVSHLTCPLPPNQSVIWLALYHRITASWRHHVTTSVSHLPGPLPPNQSVICLAPCHQTSQSFDLSSNTMSPQHCITVALWHRITASVCHLPCPLPPNQSVIWLALYHCITASPHHCVIMAPWHHITASSRHRVTALPHEIFPTTWVWIWLVNTTQHSSDWLIVPTTANQITGIEKPNYHKTLIFFPTTSLKRSHEARIDELADSNEPATSLLQFLQLTKWTSLLQFLQVNKMNKFASVSSINKMNKFASVSSINKMNKFASVSSINKMNKFATY